MSRPCQSFVSRSLTQGEKAIAQSVFGDSLQLADIRLITTWWVLKGYAVSPNGHIYFHPADFCADFSQQDIDKRAWLVHELTHVWQIQQGIKVFRKALFNRRYHYQLMPNKNFLAYGVEQQARMVEDFYRKRELQQHDEMLFALRALLPFVDTHLLNAEFPNPHLSNTQALADNTLLT